MSRFPEALSGTLTSPAEITIIADSPAGTMTFHAPSQQEPVRCAQSTPTTIAGATAYLSETYLALGSEKLHTAEDMQRTAEASLQKNQHYLRILATLMPEEAALFEIPKSGITPSHVLFGRLAIAEQLPTAKTLETAASSSSSSISYYPKGRPRAYERSLPLEADKLDLTAHHHALVTIGNQPYYLEFTSPDEIMAGRVLEAIADLPDTQISKTLGLKQLGIWEVMSEAERRLFVPGNDSTERFPARAIKAAQDFLRYLQGHSIVQYRVGDYRILSTDITMALAEEPRTDPVPSGTAQLFPSGTPVETLAYRPVIESGSEAHVTEADLAQIRETLRLVETTGDGRLAHDLASRVLCTIIGREKTRALSIVLAESNASETVEAVKARIEQLLIRSLGEHGFKTAKKSLTIGSGTGYKRVRVNRDGGRFDGLRVEKKTGERVTDRWQAGPLL
jgi:hypothetical protein